MANTENKVPEATAPEINGTSALQPAQKQKTASERFMEKVVAEFSGGVGAIALTEFQKRLAQNYFIAIDAALKAAEKKRIAKNEKNRNHDYDEKLPVAWENVNMSLLARPIVANARIGLDPSQKNHISMMPFKEGTSAYQIVFIPGYRGLELTAKKYGLEVPDAVIVDLVCSKDHFREIKQSATNPVATYEFEVVNSFDRGEIVGGFYYHVFRLTPEKNKLVVMPLKDILKRKPTYASTEFWGGKKEIWKNGKPTGEYEDVEGWYEKMCYKTVVRAAYNDITIDSQKIDSDYLYLKQLESSYNESIIAAEIEAGANSEVIDVEYEADPDTGEVIEPPAPAAEVDGQTSPDNAAPPKPAAGKGSKAKTDEPPY